MFSDLVKSHALLVRGRQNTEGPFWLDAAKTKMLALEGPTGRIHLLDARLTQVSLIAEEQARIIEARDGTSTTKALMPTPRQRLRAGVEACDGTLSNRLARMIARFDDGTHRPVEAQLRQLL